ncbi:MULTISPECIES: GNAT family N-acetyltransferase [Eubacterium]|uniref:GNAT family N-acetyltransferase n=1 Tax=Eubacterium TaxID=1730 RepID=UPI0018F7AD61|nr:MULTISPECIES: GNAT family N-acetyltransferase [Eubacterium]
MIEYKNGENRIYAVTDAGIEVGEIEFVPTGESMFIISHTEVAEDMGGLGIGKVLVEKAVRKARDENKKIIPLCPFARAEFDKHPEYRELEANA